MRQVPKVHVDNRSLTLAETVPFGDHLQLVDGDDDLDELPITCPDQNDESELASATDQPSSTIRYPRRQHCPLVEP